MSTVLIACLRFLYVSTRDMWHASQSVDDERAHRPHVRRPGTERRAAVVAVDIVVGA